MSTPLTIDEYLDRLSSDAPTPGGGSAAGIVAALAAALGSMVCALTKDQSESAAAAQLNEAAKRLRHARLTAQSLSAQDEAAYQGYLDATRLPRTTTKEKAARRNAAQLALRAAAEVPLQLASESVEILETLIPVARNGNPHLLSDARIAAILGHAAVQSALINVRVNTAFLRDRATAMRLEEEAAAIERRAQMRVGQITDILALR